jgi:ER membrane protein complex subunit 7
VDPEMRAEFEERQKSNPMNSILGGGGGGSRPAAPGSNFDMAAYLAGSGKSDKKQGGGGVARK